MSGVDFSFSFKIKKKKSIARKHLKNNINEVVAPGHKFYTDLSVHDRMLLKWLL